MKRTCALAGILALTLAACGGGGGGGAGTAATGGGIATAGKAVKLPSKITVVQPQSNPNAAKMLAGVSTAYRAISSGALRAFVAPPGSDYLADPTSYWTMVEGQETLDSINQVLCVLAQANANGVLTKTGGVASTYVAKININKCQQSKGSQGQGNQGQGNKAVKYADMTLSVTPATANAPMVAKFWLDFPPDHLYGMTLRYRVYGLLTATKDVSAANPFGEWTMSWVSETQDPVTKGWMPNTTGGAASSGTIKAQVTANGEPEILYYSSSMGYTEQAVVRYAAGQTTNGTALVRKTMDPTAMPAWMGGQGQQQGGPQIVGDYAIAFDANNVLTVNNTPAPLNPNQGSQTCRSRTQFTDTVTQYGVYHAAAGTWKGQPVSAGQRVKLTVGFPFTVDRYGTPVDGWASQWGAFVMDGSALVDGETVTRIVDFATGATQTYTAAVSQGALSRQITKAVPISQLVGLDFDYWDFTANKEYRARFNGTTGHLEAVATITWDPYTGMSSETPLNPVLDLTPGNNVSPLDIQLWPMGGYTEGSYSLHLAANTAPTLNTNVTRRVFENVNVSDPALQGAGLTLYCWQGCQQGGAPGTYYDLYANWTPPHIYTAKVVNNHLQLIDTYTNTLVTGSQQAMVLMSRLTTTNVAPWAPNASTTQYSFYDDGMQWSTTVAYVDANGQAFVFDSPIHFSYTHSQLNDRNNSATYANRAFDLVYDGYMLMGFPFNFTQNGWLESAFSLKDGVTLTDANGNNFVVKALEVMQTPNVNPNGCAGLAAPTGLTLPSSAIVQAVNFTWASKPTVTQGPRVIDGEVQY